MFFSWAWVIKNSFWRCRRLAVWCGWNKLSDNEISNKLHKRIVWKKKNKCSGHRVTKWKISSVAFKVNKIFTTNRNVSIVLNYMFKENQLCCSLPYQTIKPSYPDEIYLPCKSIRNRFPKRSNKFSGYRIVMISYPQNLKSQQLFVL